MIVLPTAKRFSATAIMEFFGNSGPQEVGQRDA